MKWTVVVVLASVEFLSLFSSAGPVNAAIKFGEDIRVDTGEETDNAISFGNDVEVRGTVKDSAVSFGGDVTVEPGGVVKGNAVCYGGDILVKNGATVKGDVICVGGSSDIEPGAFVEGEVKNIEELVFPHKLLPVITHPLDLRFGFPGVLKAIVLGPFAGIFGALGFLIGGVFFLMRLLISFAIAVFFVYFFPNHLSRVAVYLHDNFPKSILFGIVIAIIAPVLGLLMIITIIGIPLVPLLIVLATIASLFGAAGIALWIGRLVPESNMRTMMVNALLGVLIITFLKNIPVFGILAAVVFWSAAIGSVVLTRFGTVER